MQRAQIFTSVRTYAQYFLLWQRTRKRPWWIIQEIRRVLDKSKDNVLWSPQRMIIHRRHPPHGACATARGRSPGVRKPWADLSRPRSPHKWWHDMKPYTTDTGWYDRPVQLCYYLIPFYTLCYISTYVCRCTANGRKKRRNRTSGVPKKDYAGRRRRDAVC